MTGGGTRLLTERLMSPLTRPDIINARLDAVGFFLDEARLRDEIRGELRRAPDMPRALSRLALDRGGPRDLAAILSGLAAARGAASILAGRALPAELGEAVRRSAACLFALEDLLAGLLAEDLPLLKRDGGFVRDGAIPELDELRELRDQSRRVIAGCRPPIPRKPASNRSRSSITMSSAISSR